MEYLITLGILACLSALLAIGLNLVLGYGGLLSVAHPIFYGLGADGSALLVMQADVPIPAAIVLAAIGCAAASVPLALCSLRVSGDYFVIVSLGFQLGVLQIINNIEITGASGGLSRIPTFVHGPDRGLIGLGVLVLVVAVVLLLSRAVVRSPFGRALTAMRNDEEALAALGRDPVRMKMAVFALSAGIAGFAGGLYAHLFQFLTPLQFGIERSTALLTMVVVGGAATIWGPLVGAVLMTCVPQAIQFLNLPPAIGGPIQGMIFSVLVLAFLFLRPQGLMGGSRGGGGLDAWSGGRRPGKDRGRRAEAAS
ncbi:MAG TPA: branched-chain amino acid ABC transporter permease [Rhodopila sp.]|uniref:branched-chain amino acid ABC transporter permease n=1 Tax=Rhodopila sp. TaxID=2480087 RepID=UPI002B719E6F|nr:branched-chain amino acid ABC transporter permease [Rhodopila sp.]HVY16939.1 branched-chain amino acid ABC transporter permease [Rhodopila sp.]